MSALDRVLPRSAVKLNVLTRWAWGPEPARVVRVVILEAPDGVIAQVVGHDGASFVLLDERPAVGIEGRAVRLTDGTAWTITSAGCGCGSPLKKYKPIESDLRDARPPANGGIVAPGIYLVGEQ